MNAIKTIVYIISFFTIVSCVSDDVTTDINVINATTLSEVIENRTIETGAVIACAASDASNSAIVNVYYYLEAGATNIQFFETNTAAIDKDDFSNYRKLDINSEPLFEGFIQQFKRPFGQEQWVIVAYELDGEVKISNPIRTKNITKATVWSEEVEISQQDSKMPKFTWEHNANGDNAIYFQVVSTVDNGLLSGTYTYENQFQYYNTSNVVLNITPENPLTLTIGNSYQFLVMDVSEDNWVNTVFQSIFIVE
ncbi:hypothetical protein [uncultured Kordia sp.]|uniref:hypothetical protein n=1 Tax=uncultured Kordia sp. TaxID=507699 RepID=UPI00260F9846|nr:hypothetical protein [uncultured Kordia sp.]